MSPIRISLYVVLSCLLALVSVPADTAAEDTQEKPNFALRDSNGVVHRLSDHRGKWVVLEWVNFDCAPVKALYQSPARRMQSLQSTYKSKGVVWLSINSAAPKQSGYLTPAQCKAMLTKLGAQPTALLLDPQGTAGKTFRAMVTPEVRVISPRGDVVYAGGVESAGATTPVRYLDAVLSAATGGRAIPYAAQGARGCRIAYAAAAPAYKGAKAPNFALVDSGGVTRRLSDFRGKWVILEWVNYDCPYVRKHYDSSHRSMQKLQSRSRRSGIVWLSICSSARGKQGNFTSAQANARIKQLGASPAAYLHDPTGAVGRSYGARRTPSFRIISPQGTIEFAGGVDSIVSGYPTDVPKAKNYVSLAIADILAGRPIGITTAQAYGCSVKY